MLQVKRSERGLESRPPSSLASPDALLQQQQQETERREKERWKEALKEVGDRLFMKSTSQLNSHLGVSVLALASPSLGTLK